MTGSLLLTKNMQAREIAFHRAISSHMWIACPYRIIRHALQARYDILWTSSLAMKFHKPYLPGDATPFPPTVVPVLCVDSPISLLLWAHDWRVLAAALSCTLNRTTKH